MKTKSFLRLWLLAIMMCSSIGVNAYDAAIDGIYYNLDASTGRAEVVSGVTTYKGSITIPESVTYEGTTYSVTSIGEKAFSGFYGLTSITILNSVTSIGEKAFLGCYGLTSVTIGNSVTSIGYDAFYECSGLTSVTIGNSVTLIGGSAFGHCTSLTSITIPNSVTFIGTYAFSGCTRLKSIEIPNSVTFIGDYAFNNTAWYNNQPKGLVYAGKVAYRYKGTMPENTEIVLQEGTLGITISAFYGCTGLTSVTIPNSVTSIGRSAFEGCTGLTSITIGNSVTSIGGSAFYNCTGLTSVHISDLAAWCRMAFGDEYANPLCYAHHLYLNGEEVTDLVIPNGVTCIGDYAFFRCTGLKELTIEEMPIAEYDGFDVTSDIETYTQRDEEWVWDKTKKCWYVLNNRNEYEAYGVYAGDKSTSYEGKLAIVDGHEWEYAGGKWNDLGEVEETQVVEYIERDASNMGYIDLGVPFKENTRIQIKFCPTNGGGRAIMGDWNTNDSDDWRFFFSGSTLYYDFDNSRQTTSKSLNSMYEWEIGNYYIKDVGSSSTILNGTAHTDFSKRTHNMLLGTHGGTDNGDAGTDYEQVYYVKIYEGETLVKDFVPYYDGNNYGLWDNVENKPYMPTEGTWTGLHEGSMIYAKYYEIKDVPTVPESVTSIGGFAFYNCTGLTSITIPESVTSIGKSAFNGCTGLTSVTIPNSVTFIGDYAFCRCTGLESIIVGSDNTIYDSRDNCNAIIETATNTLITGCKNTVIPEGVTSIGKSAFFVCTGLTSITIPNSVTSIGDMAFYGCTGLTSITIGNKVTSIGDMVFSGCTGLTSINIPNSVKTIGGSAFDGCI